MSPIRHITIVGGGTAGWMAAAVLSHHYRDHPLKIQLVESAEIGTIGVGEATVPGIIGLNHYLQIRESEFIAATGATFKLGIEFIDWHRKGERFFHPFADFGLPVAQQPFYPCWLKTKRAGLAAPLEAYCLAIALARAGRFAQPDEHAATPLALYSYAYHFDAARYAQFLRVYAEARGVERIEGCVQAVGLDPQSGDIAHLQLADGRRLGGELFIDCSGFRGLLMEQALRTGYEDWRHWLPCDSAVALQTGSLGDPLPYTRSLALSAGWRWQIPLQHRCGNGYVYASHCIGDDEARAELLAGVEGEPLTEPRVIRFTAGMRKCFWNRNCVALGLASGFIEPLESTSISLIQTGIQKLVQFLPDLVPKPENIAEANRLNREEYERVRDFIVLHYRANQREDTDFWRSARTMPIPDSLQAKLDAFRDDGRLISYEQESFRDASWLAIYTGFGIEPARCPAGVERLDTQQLAAALEKIRHAVASASRHAPTHAGFLEQLRE